MPTSQIFQDLVFNFQTAESAYSKVTQLNMDIICINIDWQEVKKRIHYCNKHHFL